MFARSGRATVPAGKSSVTVHGVTLDGASMVLATLQHAANGNAVSSAVPKPGSSSIVITLLRAPTVPLGVAWFVRELTNRPLSADFGSSTRMWHHRGVARCA